MRDLVQAIASSGGGAQLIDDDDDDDDADKNVGMGASQAKRSRLT